MRHARPDFPGTHSLLRAHTSGSSCLTDSAVGSGDWEVPGGVWNICSPEDRDIEVDQVDCSVVKELCYAGRMRAWCSLVRCACEQQGVSFVLLRFAGKEGLPLVLQLPSGLLTVSLGCTTFWSSL